MIRLKHKILHKRVALGPIFLNTMLGANEKPILYNSKYDHLLRIFCYQHWCTQTPTANCTFLITLMLSMRTLVTALHANGMNQLSLLTMHKASFYIPENRNNFPTTRGFRMKIFMKLVNNTWRFSRNFWPTLSHLHPLQVENRASISRLVVDEDDNGKFRLERVKWAKNDDIFDRSFDRVFAQVIDYWVPDRKFQLLSQDKRIK